MKLALAQYPITELTRFSEWQENTRAWIERAATAKADLLVFPEYGSMELVSLAPIYIQEELRAQVQWLSKVWPEFVSSFEKWAKDYNVWLLTPSFPVEVDGRILNRTLLIAPDGTRGKQDKLMMTRFEDEDWGVQSGDASLTLFQTPWCQLGVNICFDVEFPDFAKELCQEGATLILAPSCTETRKGLERVHVGARARALENQCFVAVSQTVGTAKWSQAVDVNTGKAAVYGPPDLGFPVTGVCVEGQIDQVGWIYADLDFSLVESVRRDGAVFNFRSKVPTAFEIVK